MDNWLIHKEGRGYYRPNSQGYTLDLKQAGLFSQEYAEKASHPNGLTGPRDGVTIKRLSSMFKKHHHYDPEDLEIVWRHYDPLNVRTWPYYPIIMPLKDGRGPASEKEADEITWEVWDRFYNSLYSSKFLPDAINETLRLNKEVFG